MLEIRTTNDYGYRNVRKYESKALAERDFIKLQSESRNFVALYDDSHILKYAEKIGLKWYISEVK